MAKHEKRLEKMRQQPRGWRYSELTTILDRHGFEPRSRSGSHVTWKHSSGVRVTIVDKGSGEILPVYVEEMLAAIDKAKEK